MAEYERRNPDKLATNRRRYGVKKRYGLTLEEADALVARADGRCDLCGDETRPNIDHCHATGKVRGVLCAPCNKGLGLFQDSPERLTKAIAYLARSADNA